MPFSFLVPILWIILAILLIAFLASNIVIVPQAKAYIIERLGTYKCTWGTGLHFKVPLFERVARKVTLKEQVVDFPPQPVITKDNVTMQIDTVVYFQITDPKLFTYGIESPMAALENLTATTLRNIIGDLELDQTLTSRDIINTKMRAILDLSLIHIFHQQSILRERAAAADQGQSVPARRISQPVQPEHVRHPAHADYRQSQFHMCIRDRAWPR